MKKFSGIIAALLAAVMLTGCGENSVSSLPSEILVPDGSTAEAPAGEFPVKLEGGTVIEASPKRAASLSPAATEIIAELGYADRLCAVSRYCDYPEGLPEVTAGSSENPDIDRLTELAPEVVFTMSALAEREVYALESAGIKVVTFTVPESVEEYGELYGTAAAVFGGGQAGKAAAEKAVTDLKEAAGKADLGTFIYVTPKLTTAGTDTFEGEVLSLCGKNLCGESGYVEEPEQLDEAPEYIVAADSLTESDIASDQRYAGYVSAGAKLVFVPAARFERPSGRLKDVFTAISEKLSGGDGTVQAE